MTHPIAPTKPETRTPLNGYLVPVLSPQGRLDPGVVPDVSDLGGGGGGGATELFAYKASDSTLSLLNTLDADLQLTLVANAVYEFDILMFFSLATSSSGAHVIAQYADNAADDLNCRIIATNLDETFSIYNRSGRNFTDDVGHTPLGDDCCSLQFKGFYFVGPSPTQPFGMKPSGTQSPDTSKILKGSYMRFIQRN